MQLFRHFTAWIFGVGTYAVPPVPALWGPALPLAARAGPGSGPAKPAAVPMAMAHAAASARARAAGRLRPGAAARLPAGAGARLRPGVAARLSTDSARITATPERSEGDWCVSISLSQAYGVS